MKTVKQNIIVGAMKLQSKMEQAKQGIRNVLCHKSDGIDGIMVTVGLCIIALVICVLMKDQLGNFVKTIVSDMTSKGQDMLSSTWT